MRQRHSVAAGREDIHDLHSIIIAQKETVLSDSGIFRHELHHEVHRQASGHLFDSEPVCLRNRDTQYVVAFGKVGDFDRAQVVPFFVVAGEPFI